ncbi:Superkiller protein [Sparassis crispa]|uniref:Superkiller protein n=1 Tax=Sparassis crispa TaxID=139825 RepID=A0A401GGS8_9APHY|nr:Superkiller protein [Sparassis crispa]GBE81379.1 Superkiller protein [Sparassis crispa]
MSAFVKSKLKAARDAIGKKDYGTARDASLGVLEYEPDNYNAHVFLGLSLFNLGQVDESEQAYRKAIAASPDQALAWQGLSQQLEQSKKWENYAETLEHLSQLFAKNNDAVKCAETLQKLIDLRRNRSSPTQLAETLSTMLPSSSFYSTLSTLPPPDPTSPTSTSTYPTQVAVHDSLPVLEEIVSIHEREEKTKVEKDVSRRRMRLGAAGPEQLQREVEREVLEISPLPDLYNEILNHPNTSDELRRTTESKLLRHKQRCLHVLPATGESAAQKAQVATEVEELVNGMVLLGIPDELAWTSFIEAKDAARIEDYDFSILQQFVTSFPSLPLAKLILGYYGYMGRQSSDRDDSDGIAILPHQTKEAQEEFVDAMADAFGSLLDSILAHRMMVDIYEREDELENVIKVAESGLELVQRAELDNGKSLTQVRKAFNIALGVSLVHHFAPKYHSRALGIIDQVLSQDPDNVPCLMGRGFVLQRAEKWAEAGELFNRVAHLIPDDRNHGIRAKEEQAWCQAKRHDPEGGSKALAAVVTVLDELDGKDADKARCWWRLGKCYWDMGDHCREEAYRYFVTSLRHFPSFAPAFTSLGIYYSDFLSPPDPIRASKCFQKAFELDPREASAARRLAEGFAEEREWDLVEVVARRTIDGEGGPQSGTDTVAAARYLPVNAWAWKAVGVVELNRHSYPPAIQAFQIALRTDGDDQLSWLRLGEAYSKAGRFAAALKALERARELKPEDWISSYFIGEVQRQTGAYEEAIEAFESILLDHPSEVGILISLGQAHLDLGRVQLATAYTARAETSFVSSIRVVLRLIDASPGFRRVAWKIAADAVFQLSQFSTFSDEGGVRKVAADLTTLVSDHPESGLSGILSSPLLLNDTRDLSLFLLEISLAAYDYRIILGSLDEAAGASAYFDLGVALHAYARRVAPSTKQKRSQQEAVQNFKEALRLDPGNDRYWSGLGDATFLSQPRVTQHAYIKALDIDSKNPITWTNLGLFYLYHDDAELANEAFYKAQTLDPDYAPAWVGQGLVATANGHDADARALFEHAVGLTATVPEADVEFAKRIFHRPNTTASASAPSSDALFPAFFVLDRFCKKQSQDAAALHLFGLVCERIGHLELGIDSISRAISLLEAAYEDTEDPVIERQFTIAHTSVARLRLSLGDYGGALESYQVAMGLLPEEPEDRNSRILLVQAQFGSGLAHFKLGQLQDALTFLQAAMGIASEDSVLRGHIVVLLAQTLWAVGTEAGRESAKAQLLQSIESDPENLMAINALAGMGILTDDDSLVDAALSEILAQPLDRRLQRDPDRDITYLLIEHHLGQGDSTQALSVAQKAAYAEPSRPEIRRQLASLTLQQGESGAALAVIAGSSAARDDNLAQLRESLALHAVALSLSGHQDPGVNSEARKLAQKAIMLGPWDLHNWRALGYVESQSVS